MKRASTKTPPVNLTVCNTSDNASMTLFPSAAGQSVNSSGGSVIHAARFALYLILNVTMLEVTHN